MCQWLGAYGNSAFELTAISLQEPTLAGEVLAIGAWIAAYAARKNCTWDPDQVGPGETTYQPPGCQKASSNCLQLSIAPGNGVWLSGFSEFVSMVNTGVPGAGNTTEWIATAKKLNGSVITKKLARTYADVRQLRLNTLGDCECLSEESDDGIKPPGTTNNIYNDVETGCSLEVNIEGWAVGTSNQITPVFYVKPVAEGRKGGGGIIRGCNFSPVVYMEDDDNCCPGGPVIPPNPPGGPGGPGGGGDGPGDPWWAPLARGAAQGLVGALVEKLVQDLLEERYPPTTFEFIAPCDVDENDNPLTKEYTFPQQSYSDRVIFHQIALMEMLQQHLNWKTPICSCYAGEGDYRTISFISDEVSPNGRNRIRKRFKYRSKSSIGLGDLVEHWRLFVWNAGPVCVKHCGSALGAPQVWASSAAEGKRVIRHAGREAGVDPDQTGEWTVSGSDNPRFGMPGTMRVNTAGGYYWITERDGSDGRPMVGSSTPGVEVRQ